jgi:biopolymer transport protein ExbD
MTGGLDRRLALDSVAPVMNVTPLVDVVLVLLIIFMVVAPQLAEDASVDLPGIFNADPDTSGEPFKVTTQRGGQYQFQGNLYDLDGIIATLEAEHAADPLRRLVLRADAQLRYADVREFQRRLEEIGFPGMSYMVNERHREEDPPFGNAEEALAAPEGAAPAGTPAPVPSRRPASESSDGAVSSAAPLTGDGAQSWQ